MGPAASEYHSRFKGGRQIHSPVRPIPCRLKRSHFKMLGRDLTCSDIFFDVIGDSPLQFTVHTSSTAQGGGGSFKKRETMRDWLL